MEKYRAIPKDYMTVGQLAKKMGTTVRTLQYYDKEGLLAPSAESEGGRRLYTDKDMVKLHQIMSLKSLGFSLEDIKARMISLETPTEVAEILAEQAQIVKGQMENLSETLFELEALREEVLQMQTVDFKKYADIIVNLKMKNENYRLIKYLDEQTMEHARNNIDKDSAVKIIEANARLNKEAVRLLHSGVAPDSEEGLKFAEEFWNMVMEFTNGDMSMLSTLVEAGNQDHVTSGEEQTQGNANDFIGPALEAYFSKLGVNPFKGGN